MEKHKDYSLRAQDYNVKKKKLAQLSQKAREKNPDEFAFGMLSQGKAGLGKHKAATGDKSGPLSHDAVKLLKTQDAGYLRTVAARGRKEIERLKEEVGMDAVTMGASVARKKVFSEDEDVPTRGKKRTSDGEIMERDPSVLIKQPDTAVDQAAGALQEPAHADVEDLSDSPPSKRRSKKALAAQQDAAARLRAERKKRKRIQEMRVAKLEALRKRQREILAAADHLDLQRAKMARTVGGVNKNGVKFKIRERKK